MELARGTFLVPSLDVRGVVRGRSLSVIAMLVRST